MIYTYFAPTFPSKTVKPGGTSGVETRVSGGTENFSKSSSGADRKTESLDL